MRGNSGAAVYTDDYLSPTEIDDVAAPREIRATDASRLSFPIQIVIAIVVSAVSASATIWAVQARNSQTQAAMSSDIRDILTRMEGQAKLDESTRRLQDVQTDQMRQSINDLRMQTQSLQTQYADLSRQISQRR